MRADFMSYDVFILYQSGSSDVRWSTVNSYSLHS